MIDVTIRFEAMEVAFRRAFGRAPVRSSERGEVERFTLLVLEFIIERWPVDTGDSLMAWDAEPLPAPSIGIRLTNEMEYAGYVHYMGEPKTALVWERLVSVVREHLPAALGKALWRAAADGVAPLVLPPRTPPTLYVAEA